MSEDNTKPSIDPKYQSKIIEPAIVQEMGKFIGVVHDFATITHKKKIDDLATEVPEAARIDQIIRMLPTHFSNQIDELKSELNSVIEEVTSEFVNFAYSMKMASTNIDNRRKDYQLQVDETRIKLSEAQEIIARLEEENSYLREIVNLRKKLDQHEVKSTETKATKSDGDEVFEELETVLEEMDKTDHLTIKAKALQEEMKEDK